MFFNVTALGGLYGSVFFEVKTVLGADTERKGQTAEKKTMPNYPSIQKSKKEKYIFFFCPKILFVHWTQLLEHWSHNTVYMLWITPVL